MFIMATGVGEGGKKARMLVQVSQIVTAVAAGNTTLLYLVGFDEGVQVKEDFDYFAQRLTVLK